MSYLDWKVGDKVVCINDQPGFGPPSPWRVIRSGLHGLQKNKVYTIRRFGEFMGEVQIYLEEIVRPRAGWMPDGSLPPELGYKIIRFRKVQPRTTDICVFTAMLTGAKEREPA